jgi:hypothetical protein
MPTYKIEQRIHTLAQNAVMEVHGAPPTFTIEEITFSHWDFNFREGWSGDAWLAEATIEASNYQEAYGKFGATLNRILSRIALIAQSYIEFATEPFTVYKLGSDMIFFRYSKAVKGGGLMFMEREQKALKELLNKPEIPEAFFNYWNDAVNASGYSAKLLLMFSAIEALMKNNEGKKDWDKIRSLLGEDLTTELFGTKENPNAGLRQRLVHGEYFKNQDEKNYLEAIHKKIISYFNEHILSEDFLHEDVVNPQRHFFGNKVGGGTFLKSNSEEYKLELKELIEEFDKEGFGNPKKYSHFHNTSGSSY